MSTKISIPIWYIINSAKDDHDRPRCPGFYLSTENANEEQAFP